MEKPIPSSAQVPGRIAVNEFTEAAFRGVLRALEVQKLPLRPIIYGIIYLPQGLPEGTAASE